MTAMAKLSLPRVLAFVVVATGATVSATCGDGEPNPTADGGQDCHYACVRTADAGAGGNAGVTCPACANAMHECPAGCDRLGLA
jgi:hypothetical protein